jgi:hypothetical protein
VPRNFCLADPDKLVILSAAKGLLLAVILSEAPRSGAQPKETCICPCLSCCHSRRESASALLVVIPQRSGGICICRQENCEIDDEAVSSLVLDEIDRYLRSYAHHIPGEVYILLDVASDGNRKAWIRDVDETGRMSGLKSIGGWPTSRF